MEAVCDRLGCHPNELYDAAYERLALASGSSPLESEVNVTAWQQAACARPGCHQSIRPGELIGLVADVGRCCAGCCGLDRHPIQRGEVTSGATAASARKEQSA